MLSILSFNTNHGQKIDSFLSYLDSKKLRFDIYNFQEFPKKFIQSLNSYYCVHDLLPFYANYRITKQGKEFGNLTLINPKKFNTPENKVIKLESGFIDNYIRPAIWGTKISINALYFVIEYKGTRFSMINTQLTAFSHQYTRNKQIGKLVSESRSLDKSLIVGDLNTPKLSVKNNFLNGYINNSLGFKTYNFHGLRYQTDYILTKNIYNVKTEFLECNYAYSDHLPISSSFKI